MPRVAFFCGFFFITAAHIARPGNTSPDIAAEQIWGAANMRARDGCTPLESVDLLVTLLRENDNCENSLSDDYYVAQVGFSFFAP